MAEYKRDVGSGDQLQYGEAAKTNEDLQFGREIADAVGPEPGQPEVQPQYAKTEEQPFVPKSGMDQVLFGPAQGVRPLDDTAGPVPQSVIRALPQLAAIVRSPGAPPQIVAAFNYIVQRLSAEEDRRNA